MSQNQDEMEIYCVKAFVKEENKLVSDKLKHPSSSQFSLM